MSGLPVLQEWHVSNAFQYPSTTAGRAHVDDVISFSFWKECQAGTISKRNRTRGVVCLR